MKKSFIFLILNSLYFAHLNSSAASCEERFVGRVKQILFRQSERPSDPQVVRNSLLIELSHLSSVQSVVSPFTPHRRFYGRGLPPPAKYRLEASKEQVRYSAFYVPGKDMASRRNKIEFLGRGHLFLSVVVLLDAEARYTYEHWIHWPSREQFAERLGEDTVRDIFNKIYEEAYGETLESMIANNVFKKKMDHIEKTSHIEGSPLDQFAVHNIYNFDALFFTKNPHRLKTIVTETIETMNEVTGEHPRYFFQQMSEHLRE